MADLHLSIIYLAAFTSIPAEVYEAARMDGSTSVQMAWRITLPLLIPTILILLFRAHFLRRFRDHLRHYWGQWHAFPDHGCDRYLGANVDAAQAIQTSATAAVPTYQLRMALTVLTIGPIIFAYPFVQRFFVKGLTLGATKG